MKKSMVFAVVAALVILPVGLSEALTDKELADEKKLSLMGTGYLIELTPEGGGSVTSDVINFDEYKVSSNNLLDDGFAPSNFTVRVQEDGLVTWETMQVADDNSRAFWRGNLYADGSMTGVLSLKNKKGHVTAYEFKTQ